MSKIHENEPDRHRHIKGVKRRADAKRIDQRKLAFLTYFEEHGVRKTAAEATGVSYCQVGRWKDRDEEFRQAYHEVEDKIADRLEKEAIRRAVEGVEEPVYYQGEVVGSITRYSDKLLTFLLKGNRPEKYMDKVQHSGGVDQNINVKADLSKLSDGELADLERIVEKIEEESGEA